MCALQGKTHRGYFQMSEALYVTVFRPRGCITCAVLRLSPSCKRRDLRGHAFHLLLSYEHRPKGVRFYRQRVERFSAAVLFVVVLVVVMVMMLMLLLGGQDTLQLQLQEDLLFDDVPQDLIHRFVYIENLIEGNGRSRMGTAFVVIAQDVLNFICFRIDQAGQAEFLKGDRGQQQVQGILTGKLSGRAHVRNTLK